MGRKKGQKNKKGTSEEKQNEKESSSKAKKKEIPSASDSREVPRETPSVESVVEAGVSKTGKKHKKQKKTNDKSESRSDNSDQSKSGDTKSSSSEPSSISYTSKLETKQQKQKEQKRDEYRKDQDKPPTEPYSMESKASTPTSPSNAVQSGSSKQGPKKGKKQKSANQEDYDSGQQSTSRKPSSEMQESEKKNEREEREHTDFPSLEFTTQQSRKKRKQRKGQPMSLEISPSEEHQQQLPSTKFYTQPKQIDLPGVVEEKVVSGQLQVEEFPVLETKALKKQPKRKQAQPNRDGRKAGPAVETLSKELSQLQIGLSDSSKKGQEVISTQQHFVENSQGEGFELTIPHRKTRSGTKGRPIQIETNHLALSFRKLDRAVHYDVTITPSTPKKLFRRVMEEFRKVYYRNRYPAFDGTKNLYSSSELPFDQQISKDVTIQDDEQTKCYKVVIKFANIVDLTPLRKFMTANPDGIHHMVTPQEVIQCLDIVLRSAPALTCLPVGRSYFTPPKDKILALGGGMEMYYGFYQSAIIGWKPFLNIDVAHKAFPTRQNVIDLILEMCDLKQADLQTPLQRYQEDEVSRFLRTLKIRYEIPAKSATRREYRVNGLEKSASEATFKPENGSEITVEKYFQKEKKVVLKYPHMPCLWVGNKDRVAHVLLPAEFCTVVEGQVINRRMSEKLTSAMIKQAATSTKVRKDKIMAAVRKARFNDDPCVREFGLNVTEEFLKINARVLDPPALTYNGKMTVKPAQGAWRPSKFLNGISLTNWTIVNLDRGLRMDLLDEMVKLMCSQASTVGMSVSQPQRPFQMLQLRYRKELQELEELFTKKKDLQLIVVVVPNSGSHYSYVKQAAELVVGCLTQCIRSITVSRINTSTIINILQKVNAKLEGINHVLNDRMEWMKRPYMIMGADVTHPSPDARDKPSIAAVTASYDVGAFKYNICWRLQPPKVEIIEDLEKITREHLLYFYTNTKYKPERIIFFRDGVSEGQFQYVLNTEIQAIRRACTCLQPDGTYKPKITFLVVQKRHHTRFFPLNPQDASRDKNLNVPVGTCVDTEITHPTALDFCLISHASIQGVARPTKYRVLWDDADMSEDDLEQLAFHFCHMFARCTRSVSYPAPTYYAHLAAARIMAYCETGKLNMNNLIQEQERLRIKENIVKGRPMFFV